MTHVSPDVIDYIENRLQKFTICDERKLEDKFVLRGGDTMGGRLGVNAPEEDGDAVNKSFVMSRFHSFQCAGVVKGKKTFFQPRFISPIPVTIKVIYFDSNHFKSLKHAKQQSLNFILDGNVLPMTLCKQSDRGCVQFEIDDFNVPANQTLEVFSEQVLDDACSVIIWFKHSP